MPPACGMRLRTSNVSSRPLPNFDPTSNGHRLVKSSGTSEPGGGGVVLLAIVSAFTGLSLLAGATAGAVVAAILGLKGSAFITPVAIGSGVAAGVGVWLGVRISERFASRSANKGRLWPTVGGLAGLVAAVAMASRGLGPWAPFVVILLPGLGALLGDTSAGRRAARQGSRSSRKIEA
jgi:uncharacterized membrane protein